MRGGIRCKQCGVPFVRIEMTVPQLKSLILTPDRILKVEVRIARCCVKCGQEHRIYTFHTELPLDISGHMGGNHFWMMFTGSLDPIVQLNLVKSKSSYGYYLEYEVQCSCCDEVIERDVLMDRVVTGKMLEV